MEHQCDVPLLTLCASCLRGEVRLTEHHAWSILGGVSGDTARKRGAVPVRRAVDDPIGMQRFRCRGGVAEVQRGIALHVAQCVLSGARVDAWDFAVDGQIKTVAERTEAIGVRVDLILQEVAHQREGGAVGSL